jgi:hypothetical protein
LPRPFFFLPRPCLPGSCFPRTFLSRLRPKRRSCQRTGHLAGNWTASRSNAMYRYIRHLVNAFGNIFATDNHTGPCSFGCMQRASQIHFSHDADRRIIRL